MNGSIPGNGDGMTAHLLLSVVDRSARRLGITRFYYTTVCLPRVLVSLAGAVTRFRKEHSEAGPNAWASPLQLPAMAVRIARRKGGAGELSGQTQDRLRELVLP